MAYNAFISYSHAADGKLAPALQSALHRFAKPWYRLRQLHVFRDKTSLTADPGLWSVSVRMATRWPRQIRTMRSCFGMWPAAISKVKPSMEIAARS